MSRTDKPQYTCSRLYHKIKKCSPYGLPLGGESADRSSPKADASPPLEVDASESIVKDLVAISLEVPVQSEDQR